ncbi:MAG: o-succinylbenzoate--CoA ligase [Candidatus Kariarchaeaceae archaeon]
MTYWLYDTAYKYPDRPAIIGRNITLTYMDLLHKVQQAQENLNKTIIPTPQEKIGVLIENRIEFIYLIHAFSGTNCIPVFINTRLSSNEISWQLDDLRVKKIISSNLHIDRLDQIFATKYQLFSIDSGGGAVQFLNLHYEYNVDYYSEFNLDKLQSLIYTSGTTGRPKASIISYSNIFHSVMASNQRLGVEENDIWMLTIPMYHVGGMSIIFRSCINGTAIFLDERFQPENIANLINEYAITQISLVPTMLSKLISIKVFDKKCPTLRLILLGGDRANSDLILECSRLELPVATTYGMTESVSQVATALPRELYKKPNSVGKPLDGIKVRILDQDNKELSHNEIGEITISGKAIISGYYGVLSSSFTKLGFKTGDLGFIDEDGDLHILQRRIDLIISGGENIYPSQIEYEINKIPGILSSCVIGIDNAEWGQIPVVAIIVDSNYEINEKTILDHCEKSLAPYKIPKRIYFVNDYPTNSLGKIDRNQLKKLILNYYIES